MSLLYNLKNRFIFNKYFIILLKFIFVILITILFINITLKLKNANSYQNKDKKTDKKTDKNKYKDFLNYNSINKINNILSNIDPRLLNKTQKNIVIFKGNDNGTANIIQHINSFQRDNPFITEFLNELFKKQADFISPIFIPIEIESDKDDLYLLYSMSCLYNFLRLIQNNKKYNENEKIRLLEEYILKFFFWLLISYFYKLSQKLRDECFDIKNNFYEYPVLLDKLGMLKFLYILIDFISNFYNKDNPSKLFDNEQLYSDLKDIFIHFFFKDDEKYYEKMIDKLDYKYLNDEKLEEIKEQILIYDYEEEKDKNLLYLKFLKIINSIIIYLEEDIYKNELENIDEFPINMIDIINIIRDFLFGDFKTLNNEIKYFKNIIEEFNKFDENKKYKSTKTTELMKENFEFEKVMKENFSSLDNNIISSFLKLFSKSI